jgi:hypothetical protein
MTLRDRIDSMVPDEDLCECGHIFDKHDDGGRCDLPCFEETGCEKYRASKTDTGDAVEALIRAEIARELRTLAKDCAERHTDEVVDRQVGWNNALTEVAKEARRRADALEKGEGEG